MEGCMAMNEKRNELINESKTNKKIHELTDIIL